MKNISLLIKGMICLSLLILIASPDLTAAQTGSQPATPKSYELEVLQMDETGATLELRLLDFTLENQQVEGENYQQLVVPGLNAITAPGQPQLPAVGELLGTPPGGIEQLNILESEVEIVNEVRLLPTPRLTYPNPEEPPVETFSFDDPVYQADAFFPDSPAAVGMTGKLREQPVAQVRLYPSRYNPVQHSLEVYRRLRVQVIFAPAPVGAQAVESEADTPYEQLLQKTLLNSDSLPSRGATTPSTLPPAISPQSQTPALKIFVDEDGLYQIGHQDLVNAGFTLASVDPRQLRLTNKGQEVAIFVNGEADGVFDPGDWLEFYGLAETSEFTERNVYWLTTANTPGLRMAERDGALDGSDSTPTAFYTSRHFEENHKYWQQLPNGEGQDHWFWRRFPSAPHTSTFSFELKNVADVSTDGLVRVMLHGRTSVASVNPDHHTQVFLNGTLIDEAWWDGETPYTHEITVPQQHFREGDNTLKIRTPGDTGAGVDSLYLNYFEVGFWQSYVAEQGQLYFAAPDAGLKTFLISSFNDSDIHLYDISDPLRVSRLTNSLIEADGNKYRLQFEDNPSPDSRYLAITRQQKRSPAELILDTSSSLRSPNNSADYLIITHEAFIEAAQRLADYHTDQSLRTQVVPITNVYDEFSDGLFTPQAIREFLSYAYHHWTPPTPMYVLLMGDANYDYKDYLNSQNPNYVPTALFESNVIGQTSTDNWFVSISGDDVLPDMFIGRLSVRTLTDAHHVVDKILTYEEQPSPEAWQQQAIFVADDGSNFESISDRLIGTLYANYTPQRIYPSAYTQPYDPTSDIIEAIDQGALIVDYMGHGSVTTWGSWSGKGIFSKGNMSDLNNGPRYPFLVTGNCSNGLFAHPTTRKSLGEEFVELKGLGGIAAWSPTGLGYAFWHEAMVEALYQAIFDEYSYQLGPATTAAKIQAFAALGWGEPIEIFTLFGDPALALNVVQPRLTIRGESLTETYVRPGQLVTYSFTYINSGNEAAENVTLTQVYDANTIFHSATPLPTSGDNKWEFKSLPPGAEGTITVTVRVSAAVLPGTKISSQVILTSDNLSPQTLDFSNIIAYLSYLPSIFRE